MNPSLLGFDEIIMDVWTIEKKILMSMSLTPLINHAGCEEVGYLKKNPPSWSVTLGPKLSGSVGFIDFGLIPV